MNDAQKEKLRSLRKIIREMKSTVVAFSGGVDSSLMLKVAHDELGAGATGVIAVSSSLPAREKSEALDLAQTIGVRVELVGTSEVSDPAYAANPSNRCFFCKDHVYAALRQFADARGIECVIDGMNADDTLDVRPGRAAAKKHGVRSPLHEAGLDKADVRAIARGLDLPNWDKPAAACLSSRIAYGTAVSDDLLHRIEAGEEFLLSLGFRELRVRHHGEIARVEVPPQDLARATVQHEVITGGLRALGWTYVTLDLAGFRSGSMNEVLPAHRPTPAVA